VRVHVDREAEVAGQVAAHLVPGAAGVVAAHDVPVLLHEQRVRARRVHRELVHAVPDLRLLGGDLTGLQALVDGQPAGAAVVGAEGTGGADGGEDAPLVGGVQQDRVQAQPARTGLPLRSRAVAAQP
jgi:hypothetical protein